LEFLKKAVGVASGAAEAAGGIARTLKTGDVFSIISAAKGGIRVLESVFPNPREREPLDVRYYMEVVAATIRSRVEALKPEYAVLVFDNVSDKNVVTVTNAAMKIANGIHKYGARAVAFVVTTPLGMKKVMRSSASDDEHVYYAVIENPTREEFKSLFYDLGGYRIQRYGYTADELYNVTSGNLKATRHVIKNADSKSLCDTVCLKELVNKFGISHALLRLKDVGLFDELQAYVSEGGSLSSAAIDQFMKYGLVYYKPRELAEYGLLALPYKYSHRGEYIWSSKLVKHAVAEAVAAGAKNAYKVRAATAI